MMIKSRLSGPPRGGNSKVAGLLLTRQNPGFPPFWLPEYAASRDEDGKAICMQKFVWEDGQNNLALDSLGLC